MVRPEQDEDDSRQERLGELISINAKVAAVTEAAADAAAKALEAAEAARRARKSKRATTKKAKPADSVEASRPPAQDAGPATELNASPPTPLPETRRKRDHVISIRLDDRDFERVRKLAVDTGRPLAASARSLLVKALDRADEN